MFAVCRGGVCEVVFRRFPTKVIYTSVGIIIACAGRPAKTSGIIKLELNNLKCKNETLVEFLRLYLEIDADDGALGVCDVVMNNELARAFKAFPVRWCACV